jgi:hypothetical protein
MQSVIRRFPRTAFFCTTFALTPAMAASETLSAQQSHYAGNAGLERVVLAGDAIRNRYWQGRTQSWALRNRKALLTAMTAWLSANFNLLATGEHPRLELVSSATMAVLLHGGHGRLSPDQATPIADGGSRSMSPDNDHDILGLYDYSQKTIYLPEGWTGATPAELSILVHELVHHLQYSTGWKYNCPQEREKLAYTAQARWLNLFGQNLMDEFQMDGFTILVRTNCIN